MMLLLVISLSGWLAAVLVGRHLMNTRRHDPRDVDRRIR